jgi:hypothetical protein
MKIKILALVLITHLGFSQDKVTKVLGDFDTVKVFDKITVELIPSNENKIEIKGNKNDLVELITKNGELKIRMPFGQLLAGEGISAQVYFKRLEGIEASEGAFISCESPFKQMALVVNSKEGSEINLKIAVKKVSIQATSGGIITLSGKADNQDVLISSGGELNAHDLKTVQSSVSINAGGTATVFVSDFVDAKVRAGGTITIHGNPKQVNQKTVLGGSIVIQK